MPESDGGGWRSTAEPGQRSADVSRELCVCRAESVARTVRGFRPAAPACGAADGRTTSPSAVVAARTATATRRTGTPWAMVTGSHGGGCGVLGGVWVEGSGGLHPPGRPWSHVTMGRCRSGTIVLHGGASLGRRWLRFAGSLADPASEESSGWASRGYRSGAPPPCDSRAGWSPGSSERSGRGSPAPLGGASPSRRPTRSRHRRRRSVTAGRRRPSSTIHTAASGPWPTGWPGCRRSWISSCSRR